MECLSFELTLSMLRLRSSMVETCKRLWKPSKPCHVGIHWKALAEYFHMSTHLPGFQSFSNFLHHFVLAKLATSSIRVKQLSVDSRIVYASWRICRGLVVNPPNF